MSYFDKYSTLFKWLSYKTSALSILFLIQKTNRQDMAENFGKFLIIFIIGIVVFSIGMALSSLEVVLLGGLLSGISGMIMLVSVASKWK